jgi:hypothetical protein
MCLAGVYNNGILVVVGLVRSLISLQKAHRIALLSVFGRGWDDFGPKLGEGNTRHTVALLYGELVVGCLCVAGIHAKYGAAASTKTCTTRNRWQAVSEYSRSLQARSPKRALRRKSWQFRD